jgi:eukaryotic-like serine/threonine-protein kinase
MSTSRDQRRQLYEKRVGTTVAEGKYIITGLIGFGGMGAVYEAIQRNMDRKIALKLIHTHDPTTVARFEREALTISKLQHPNTVTVFDFGQTEDSFLYLTMELLAGKTLTEVIEDEGPLSCDRVVHIASQVCRSLAEAHRAGIVHRDVKPDNIILIEVDQDLDFAKVLDFGIAKAVLGDDDVQLTGDGRIIGTPRYMSPEQILAEAVDHRSDIYSLGCILFEMLCGAPPFQQSSTTALMLSHTQDPPPEFAQRLDPSRMNNMSVGVERVVRKALSKLASNRYESTEEFRLALEGALSEPAGIRPTFDTGSRTELKRKDPSRKSKRPLLLVAIVSLVLVIGVAIFWSIRRDDVSDAAHQSTELGSTAALHETSLQVQPPSKTGKEKTPDERYTYLQISIQSAPMGASVFRGSTLIGQTPMTHSVPSSESERRYRLELPGFHTQEVLMPIDAKAGDRQEFSYTLNRVQPNTGGVPARATRPKSTSTGATAAPRATPSKTGEPKTEDKPMRKTRVELLD